MTPALELLDLLDGLERMSTSVIELVRAGRPLEPWRLYPGETGIVDRHTRCQFYYHRHGADHEAGHFHTVRLFADHTVHLVAILMTPAGWPQAASPRTVGGARTRAPRTSGAPFAASTCASRSAPCYWSASST
jgi:hypothetical protein